MLREEITISGLRGRYHDVLLDPSGQITWDRGWRKNTIVVDCRRLLSGFMRGESGTLGIQGLQVGAGDPAWDLTTPPPALPADTRLVDPNPFLVPSASLQFQYLDPTSGAVSVAPTSRLQVVATLGLNTPSWPDANHASGTLREFALVGELDGATVLINAVRHVAILKDPVSTLVRTIQLVF